MYIVFEGTVGTGKTTQSQLLREYLQIHYPHRDIIWVREPGKTPIAEAIRTLAQGTEFPEEMDPVCEAYLYSAARAQLVNTIIKPALNANAIIISDRSFWSSLSYQGYAKEVGIETIWEINKPIIESCIPDLVLFFDMPVEIGLSRTFDGAGDKHELNGIEFFEKAYQGYLACLKDTRFSKKVVIIDALGTIDEISQHIITHIQPLV